MLLAAQQDSIFSSLFCSVKVLVLVLSAASSLPPNLQVQGHVITFLSLAKIHEYLRSGLSVNSRMLGLHVDQQRGKPQKQKRRQKQKNSITSFISSWLSERREKKTEDGGGDGYDDDDGHAMMEISPPSSISIVAMPSSTSSSSSANAKEITSHHPYYINKSVPYLIITNISKRQNVRNLLQIAAAYGVPTVFVVGQKKFVFDHDDDDGQQGDEEMCKLVNGIHDNKTSINDEENENDHEGVDEKNNGNRIKKSTDIPAALQRGIRDGRLAIKNFDKLEECVAYIKRIRCCCVSGGEDRAVLLPATKKNIVPIIGVEIDNSSINLEEEPFSSFSSSCASSSSSSCNCNSIAFMMGNEGSGMSLKQMSICDGFIRISQYGGGTASLNVSVAAALVLHRYHHWRRGDVVKSIVRCADNT